MKRAIRREGKGPTAAASALALLERSVLNGHRRLALLRLRDALQAGAQVPAQHWIYCRRVAEACPGIGLQSVFLQLAQQACASAPGIAH